MDIPNHDNRISGGFSNFIARVDEYLGNSLEQQKNTFEQHALRSGLGQIMALLGQSDHPGRSVILGVIFLYNFLGYEPNEMGGAPCSQRYRYLGTLPTLLTLCQYFYSTLEHIGTEEDGMTAILLLSIIAVRIIISKIWHAIVELLEGRFPEPARTLMITTILLLSIWLLDYYHRRGYFDRFLDILSDSTLEKGTEQDLGSELGQKPAQKDKLEAEAGPVATVIKV
ncbi:MAG: hypothetical protein Q9184_006116 [Pyrenodesmia sp. 2 TL-2023]